MRRKIIKQGHNTLTVTLPKKWCDKENLNGGDELNIEEEGAKLVLSPPKNVKKGSTKSIDISDLDRSTVLFVIREAYRRGYDELNLHFENQMTPRFRDGQLYKTISFIHYEINNLIGYEVISQKENSCVVKDISEGTEKEFEPILRRVFLLTLDTFNDFITGIKEKDADLMATIEEKHNSITKFVSYCMRLLSKNIYNYSHESNLELYHVLASMDTVADLMKYTSRDIVEEKIIFSSKSVSLVNQIGKLIKIFYELFFDYKHSKLVDFNKERYVLLKAIKKDSKQLPTDEAIIVSKLSSIIEILNDLVKSKLSLAIGE